MIPINKGLMTTQKKLQELKKQLLKVEISPVVPFDLTGKDHHIFDLSHNNEDLELINLDDEIEFSGYISNILKKHNCLCGVGGYGENRPLYNRSSVFSDDENRTLHLGIDIWADAGTPVCAPLDGSIHSFNDNNNHADYGPTIILKHTVEQLVFYTLYGHLSKKSLLGLSPGKAIFAGEKLGTFGEYHENVHWPPHLHFQIIWDLEGNIGDYPGVCKPSESDKWLQNCPDPNIILKCKGI